MTVFVIPDRTKMPISWAMNSNYKLIYFQVMRIYEERETIVSARISKKNYCKLQQKCLTIDTWYLRVQDTLKSWNVKND